MKYYITTCFVIVHLIVAVSAEPKSDKTPDQEQGTLDTTLDRAKDFQIDLGKFTVSFSVNNVKYITVLPGDPGQKDVVALQALLSLIRSADNISAKTVRFSGKSDFLILNDSLILLYK